MQQLSVLSVKGSSGSWKFPSVQFFALHSEYLSVFLESQIDKFP